MLPRPSSGLSRARSKPDSTRSGRPATVVRATTAKRLAGQGRWTSADRPNRSATLVLTLDSGCPHPRMFAAHRLCRRALQIRRRLIQVQRATGPAMAQRLWAKRPVRFKESVRAEKCMANIERRHPNRRQPSSAEAPVPLAELIEQQIFLLHGHRVMLSANLARLNEVEPRALVQAVKRNIARFPEDFMFQLNEEEFHALKSQIVISS